MHLKQKPPDIPDDLLQRLGEPEDVFGPNLRFRVISVICGSILIVLGSAFLVTSLARDPNLKPQNGPISSGLVAGLIATGLVVLVAVRVVPMNWVFVCPGGVIRTRGATWDAVGWDQIARFEDATITPGAATIRQCRLVLKDGAEWGFLADWIGDYRRLTRVLRRAIDERKK